MTETPNLHLTKDAQTELYDVRRVNANSDKIDAFAGTVSAAINGLATVASTGAYADLTGRPTIDSALSDTSANAVQNKAVKEALDGKAAQTDMAKLLTAGTEIPENGDVHNCTQPGHYYCTAANSQTIAHLPVQLNTNVSFGVWVEPIFGENRILRRLTFNIGTSVFAFRIFYQWVTSAGVSDWYEVGLTRIEPPAAAQSVGGDASA